MMNFLNRESQPAYLCESYFEQQTQQHVTTPSQKKSRAI